MADAAEYPRGVANRGTGNPGTFLGTETVGGVPYARYRAEPGTWVSASLKQQGYDRQYGRDTAYGAYTGIVRQPGGSTLARPDRIAPKQEYLIPLARDRQADRIRVDSPPTSQGKVAVLETRRASSVRPDDGSSRNVHPKRSAGSDSPQTQSRPQPAPGADYSKWFLSLTKEQQLKEKALSEAQQSLSQTTGKAPGEAIGMKMESLYISLTGELVDTPALSLYYSARDRGLDKSPIPWVFETGWMIGEALGGETISGRGIDREAHAKQIAWRIVEHYGELTLPGELTSLAEAGVAGTRGLLRSSSASPELLAWGEAWDARRALPRFRYGAESELESVVAKVRPESLGKGQATNPAARERIRALGLETDQAGHAYGEALGGQRGAEVILKKPVLDTGVKKLGNFVPLNATMNTGKMATFEKFIVSEVRAGKKVYVRVTMQYIPGSTRPYAVVYQARVNGVTIRRFFPNPF